MKGEWVRRPKPSLERRVDRFFTTSERMIVRTFMFAYFVYDLSRFARLLLQ